MIMFWSVSLGGRDLKRRTTESTSESVVVTWEESEISVSSLVLSSDPVVSE